MTKPQTTAYTKKECLQWDEGQQKTYEFITNNFELDAATIAKLYQQRWQIELFFKN